MGSLRGLLRLAAVASALMFVGAMGDRAWSVPALHRSTDPTSHVRSDSPPRPSGHAPMVPITPGIEQKQRLRREAERQRRARPQRALLVAVPRRLPIKRRPGGQRVVGHMPAGSLFYDIPTVAWVHRRDETGRYGLVTVPYSEARSTGWIRIASLEQRRTAIAVRADLSRRQIVVTRLGKVIMRFPASVGAPGSPTPPGRYFVTDRVPFDASSPLGGFAFGISGIQPRLPAGWQGGNQLAIHGTNDPSSIGEAASAGCLRVSARALQRLKPLLTLGTPVTITP
jgi:lipoprotein-anchoring transpeptidase ErfK/SrfK